MAWRRAFAGLLATGIAALGCATSASAAAPSLQVGDLRGGTAILQYDSARARDLSSFDRALRGAGGRTVFFQRLGLVAVRGRSIELRRAARVAGVRSAHMDAPIKLLLHESGPLVYRADPGAAWASGVGGGGGAGVGAAGVGGGPGAAWVGGGGGAGGVGGDRRRGGRRPAPRRGGAQGGQRQGAGPRRHFCRGGAGLPGVPGVVLDRHDRRARDA